MKVVLDCGNGTAGKFAPPVFRAAGIEVIEQYCDLDWTFPHHNPNPELLDGRSDLAALVKKNKANLGVLLDGDGDRLGIIDEKGNNIWADRFLILMAREVLKKKRGAKIVFDVKCTEALPEDIKAHGGVPIMWKTGHSWIKAALREQKADLAGERSGHIFFVDDYYGYDDATFAAMRLIQYLSSIKETLSEELATAPQYVISPTIHVECADDKKYGVVDKLVAEFKATGNKVIDINGARVYMDGGWGLVRASSNEPVLVLVFEAKTQKQLNEIKAEFKKRLSKYPEIGKVWHNE